MTALWRLTATETVARIAARDISAREATQAALDRLAAVNPAINAVVQEMPEQALAAADAVDAAIARGEAPGPLAGVPVTVKVNVDQKGFATTNGLRIQKDLVATEDNPVVANLKRAGAVIIGRTNTPAFSLRWFTRNSLHGHTRNPRDPALTPGGSSGGAAAAVAAGIGAIGHGTDIGGSIRYPAYACGIHGLRPTLGRVPAWNPSGPERAVGAQLMAVSGPMARSIADLRLGLQAMAAEDLRDPWWVPAPLSGSPYPRRAALCLRPEGMDTKPEVEQALRDAALRLQNAGWSIVETACPPLREPAALQAMLWLAESRRGLNAALEREGDPDARFVFAQMEALCPQPDLNTFQDALQARAAFTRQWQLFLKNYPVLLVPVSAELPFPDLLDVQSPEAFRRVMAAQLVQVGLPLMGLPGLTVATGAVDGVPVGVQLIGGRYREDVLLDAGAVIEAGYAPVGIADPVAG
ncbi:amidase family protein [Roseomonas marmotae]|uniref:Amidase family protein n=1 Tax=Roseomonas marmotae TaxID=2768161 RepID=A0ABS3K973_9PROT|nr:amidase family protein [Roseomonas marmotae]MBO1074024.1 amidase family protein [Roseomonas marmotae]QTI78811.1 amidase family protein [Roseomonas marmotae]